MSVRVWSGASPACGRRVLLLAHRDTLTARLDDLRTGAGKSAVATDALKEAVRRALWGGVARG